MTKAEFCPLPRSALLERYDPAIAPDAHGGYVDSFSRTVTGDVSLADFVYAFYTSPVFRVERWILAALKLPANDQQAFAVSRGAADKFAAWSVEQRSESELLMCDVRGHTRSWFRVERVPSGTRLFFGSAIVPIDRDRHGSPILGRGYRLLLGFHRLYSKIILNSAARRLS